MNDHVDGKTDSGHGAGHATIVIEGYIGEMSDERVVVFPCLDRRYSVEIQRRDVLDFEAGRANGACRFVVSGAASVLERTTVVTTTRRIRNACDISCEEDTTIVDGEDLGDWTRGADWSRPD